MNIIHSNELDLLKKMLLAEANSLTLVNISLKFTVSYVLKLESILI